MKKITAYVNTVRVHWLVEELETAGIKEMMVTEYFSPSSKISRMELLAHDDTVETVREIIHRVGTTGEAGDHSLFIEEYDPSLPGQIPLGKRTSKLEESRVKQLVNFLLHGSHRKITTAFLVVTVSVFGIALYVYAQTKSLQRTIEETTVTIRLLSETTAAIESALLEEMLAAERFHRGEAGPALTDFRKARGKLIDAVATLSKADAVSPGMVDSLRAVEHQFHLIAGGMFDIMDSLSLYGTSQHRQRRVNLSGSHSVIMVSLDALRFRLLSLLATLELDTKRRIEDKQDEMERLLEEVRISLLLLVVGVIAITVTIWFMIERNVSRPIRRLVAEARTIDSTELR